MKAAVIYDSVFGNTQKVAQAVAASLGGAGETDLLRPSEADASGLAGVNLLVVGSPTRGFRPTEAMSNWLRSLPSNGLRGVSVAAFDTRFKADEIESAGVRLIVKSGGYAAKRIASRLTRAGGTLVAPPEGFYVEDTEGPLKPGELERAAAWAAALVSESQPARDA